MKVQALLLVWAFTILCLVSYTAGFSHGASLSACTDMRPKHIRAHLQNPKNNYITIHTNMSFFPGDKVPVTVRSTRDFMGFMLQARRVLNDQIAGTFVYIPPGSKLLTCFEDGDTVTHSDKSLKRNLSFVWKAPNQPIGDIRFFLSVVQSYFVYWARIESSTVSQQTQNKTTTGNRTTSTAIKSVSPQEPSDLKAPFTAVKESVILDTQLSTFIPSSPIWIAATLILDSAYNRRQVSEPSDNEKFLSEFLADPATSEAISHSGERQTNGSGTDGDLMLESSLQFQDLSFIAQDYSSSHSSYNGTENISAVSTSLLCLTCKEGMEKVPPGRSEESISKSTPPITASVLIQLWDSALLSDMEKTPKDLSSEEDADVYQTLSAALMQVAEKQPTTPKASAKFLPQAEVTTSGQEKRGKKGISGNRLLKVTKIPEAAVSGEGRGGGGPNKKSQLVAAQLGVLLGCSAVFGMVVAITLRCLHSQYCHKRTEVSFSEPDSNVIALQESGEMMHFRKIRENSFVLVQAEYNWISPSGSGKKAVI
ncbi:reelin domain-containing protein 1 [Sceloporus undulatus]|uniref:reelin domain-containing protein 1 n=1 Tax=Sceloporus undulatus TaxID=8520 RepID=UPI001C4BC819|nr:reelin domain-containing protein 1 [Sceloporus undulatus]